MRMSKKMMVAVVILLSMVLMAGYGVMSTTVLAAEQTKAVEKTYTATQGDAIHILSDEVMGAEGIGSSWKLYSLDLKSPFITGYAKGSFNPQYFTGLKEKGLVHPEWSCTWGAFLNVPINMDSGDYFLNLLAVNNSDPAKRIKIKITIIVKGTKQDVPFAISGQAGTKCSRDSYFIPKENSNIDISAIYTATSDRVGELIIKPVAGDNIMIKADFPQGMCHSKGADLRIYYFQNYSCGDHTCYDQKVAYYQY